MKLVKIIKERIALYYMKKAVIYAEKGGFNNIMKSMDYIEKSLLFQDMEQRKYLKNGFEEMINKYSKEQS